MNEIIENFKKARQFRSDAGNCNAFQAAKKLELADKALNAFDCAFAAMIAEMIDLKKQLESQTGG